MPARPTGSSRDESVRLADWKPVPPLFVRRSFQQTDITPGHSLLALFSSRRVEKDLALNRGPYSAAMCAPFSVTERFMKSTRKVSAPANTAKTRKTSK
jgi:hypothetical protein